MEGVNPIMIGRNAAPLIAEAQGQPVNNLMAQVQAAQSQSPMFQEQAFAVEQAPVVAQTSVQQPGGCQLYFQVRQIVKVILDMPWDLVSEKFDVAFISNAGELVIADLPPMYDSKHDVFVLRPGTESRVIGRVDPVYAQHWRQSITARPDSGLAEIPEEYVEAVEPPKPVAEEPVVLEDTTDYSAMSFTQKKAMRRKLMDKGMAYEELPDALKNTR